MAKKVNPWLAQFEAKKEAEKLACLSNLAEIDRITLMLTVHRDLQVGPGRAGKIINDFMSDKDDIATRLLEETEGDSEFLVLRRDLAYELKEIFGDTWAKYRELFPMLKMYW